MAIKSESQKRRLAQLVKDGKMSQAEFDKMLADTPPGKLPDRISSTNTGQVRSVRKVR